jgi:hypothetical protein
MDVDQMPEILRDRRWPATIRIGQGHAGNVPTATGQPPVATAVPLRSSLGPMARAIALHVDEEQARPFAYRRIGPVV